MDFNGAFKFVTLNLQEYTSVEIYLIAFISILVLVIFTFIFLDQTSTNTYASLPMENFISNTEEGLANKDSDLLPYGTPLSSMQELQNLSSKKPVVLLVYDMNCMHCKHLRPIWQELFNDIDLNQIADFRSIGDGNLRNTIETSANVTGYPSLLVVTENLTYNQYNGSRDFHSMKQYIHTFTV